MVDVRLVASAFNIRVTYVHTYKSATTTCTSKKEINNNPCTMGPKSVDRENPETDPNPQYAPRAFTTPQMPRCHELAANNEYRARSVKIYSISGITKFLSVQSKYRTVANTQTRARSPCVQAAVAFDPRPRFGMLRTRFI
jgi:hypothetical protein